MKREGTHEGSRKMAGTCIARREVVGGTDVWGNSNDKSIGDLVLSPTSLYEISWHSRADRGWVGMGAHEGSRRMAGTCIARREVVGGNGCLGKQQQQVYRRSCVVANESV
jgi:hypothetical protein